MPIFKTKNNNFFKKWSPEMAYVLGFFAADGNMIKNKRGAHFIEFQSIDKEIINKIRKVFKSNLAIGEYQPKHNNWRRRYRLQIGSKQIFDDLVKLGLTPQKSKTIKLPSIPKQYFSHFVRGYFDGDGNVWSGWQYNNGRKRPTRVLIARFICGSKKFLKSLKKKLEKDISLKASFQYRDKAYRLCFSTQNALKLYKFMYKSNNNLCLRRKKIIFEGFDKH